jgi:membrane protease YdiL (CAAX protease family)
MTSNNVSSAPLTAVRDEPSPKKVNWKQVGAFLALTFGLTWLLDLALYLKGGLTNPAAGTVLQFMMLLPAFSAMVLGMFFFKDSPINIRNNHSTTRWFNWYFLAFTLLYAVAAALGLQQHPLFKTVSTYLMIPGLIGLILAIVLRVAGGRNSFTGVGMGGGKIGYWFLYGLGIILFLGLQTLLNWVFKMGQPADTSVLMQQAAAAGMSGPVFMIIATVQTVILGPFLGLLVTFGEEYGWRGFLQPALTRMGRVRGVALLGIIWGIWHLPVIWMGYNFPGHPYLGSLSMILFCTGLGFMLGYAVLKAKGVWIAAFLHALFNQTLSYFMTLVYTPRDPTFSFGIGLLGMIPFALAVLFILRDPVWKQTE